MARRERTKSLVQRVASISWILIFSSILTGSLRMLYQDEPSGRIRDVKLLFLFGIITLIVRAIWPERLDAFWTRRSYTQKMAFYRLHQASIAIFFLTGLLRILHVEQLFLPNHVPELRDLLIALWEASFLSLLVLAGLTGMHDNAYVPQHPRKKEQNARTTTQTQP